METNNKKYSKNMMLWIVLVAVSMTSFYFLESMYNKGGINSQGDKGTETYTSLSEVKTSLDLTLPEALDESSIIEVRSIMGQIIEVRAEHYILKAAQFVDYNADPLGLYDTCEIDNKYSVEDSSIKYVRYRLGYSEYKNCTIINWCNETTSLGVMLDDIYTEEEVMELMGINEENIREFHVEVSSPVQTEVTWYEYSIANGEISIRLPDTMSAINSLDLNGYTILFLNKTRCLVVVYSDYDLDTDVFGGQGQIDIDDDIRLNYLLKNEFKEGTEEYIDYALFLNNIQDIANSIKRN